MLKSSNAGDNGTDCGGSAKGDPLFRQCPSASTKLTQVNAAESPLAQAFIDAGSIQKHPVKNLNRWRAGQSSAAFMTAQNTIHQGSHFTIKQSRKILIQILLKPGLESWESEVMNFK